MLLTSHVDYHGYQTCFELPVEHHSSTLAACETQKRCSNA